MTITNTDDLFARSAFPWLPIPAAPLRTCVSIVAEQLSLLRIESQVSALFDYGSERWRFCLRSAAQRGYNSVYLTALTTRASR